MLNNLKISRGNPHPLGAVLHKQNINFAIHAYDVSTLQLCFFRENHSSIALEVPLDPIANRTGDIWHVQIENLPLNLDYAYLATYSSAKHTPSQFLLDPYALATNTIHDWGKVSHYHPLGQISESPVFDWENDQALKTPLKETIIYEMHARGFTQHPSSLVNHRGTFLGIIEKIPHLVELGVTAVELLPIHEFNECEYDRINPLTQEELYNYWGYSTVSFFAPMNRYASSNQAFSAQLEFKTMVKALHKHGIEVILDVVYNHTGEGNHLGPTLSYRGLDPKSYYMIHENGEYLNFSGCGNTLNCNNPITSEFILASLRYWVTEMHVDGFRFDLATIFLRDSSGHPMHSSPLIDAITSDPLLKHTKLIAEPWDAGGMYSVGSFAPPGNRWSEWNGSYRDDIRSYIKGDAEAKNLFATRLCGSQDIYGKDGHTPCTSLNFITCHDGFSLADLVSYNSKHNIANGENNRDGLSDNRSWNCGEEGETGHKKVLALRRRQMRNFHVALMISQGIPMVLMGDEYGHTKKGNNNTWCQDNDLNWFLWDSLDLHEGFYRFFRMMIHFRKQHKHLFKRQFLSEQDIVWHGPQPYFPEWDSDNKFIAFTLIDSQDGNHLYIAFNASHKEILVTFPRPDSTRRWYWIIATHLHSPLDFNEEANAPPADPSAVVPSHSAIILKLL